MGLTQLAVFGDSTAAGDVGAVTGWVGQLRDRLANIPGLGPVLSTGVSWSQRLTYTTGADAWTTTLSTDAWDKMLYGLGLYANGQTKVCSSNVTPAPGRPIVGVQVYFVDYTNGGNWQYSIDGGTWTNVVGTGVSALNHDNKIVTFYLAAPVTSSFQFRAYDGSVGVGCFPAGLEYFFVAPQSATSGLIVHNFAMDAQTLHGGVLATSGDRLALVDSVSAGLGSPLLPTPNAGVLNLNINDVKNINNTTTWAADLTTFRTRMAPLGPVGFVSLYETDPGVYNTTSQANYRAQTKTTAAGFSPAAKVIDIFDAWSANGWGGAGVQNAIANTAGLLLDLTHESQLGHNDLATRIYWFVRNQFLALGAVPTKYTVVGAVPVTGYKAARPVPAYAACLPIALREPA